MLLVHETIGQIYLQYCPGILLEDYGGGFPGCYK